MRPGLKVAPRVYYIGLPKTFIGATVYDPSADEVVQGAAVTLQRAGFSVVVTVTDEFGDFLVDDLEQGVYNVTIRKDGYDTIRLAGVTVDKDLNLSDLAMTSGRR